MPHSLIHADDLAAFKRRIAKNSDEQNLVTAAREFEKAHNLFQSGILNTHGDFMRDYRLRFYAHYQSGALALDKLTSRLSRKGLTGLFKDSAEGFDAQRAMSTWAQAIQDEGLFPFYDSTVSLMRKHLASLEESEAVVDFISGMRGGIYVNGHLQTFDQEWSGRFAMPDQNEEGVDQAPEGYADTPHSDEFPVKPYQDDLPVI